MTPRQNLFQVDQDKDITFAKGKFYKIFFRRIYGILPNNFVWIAFRIRRFRIQHFLQRQK